MGLLNGRRTGPPGTRPLEKALDIAFEDFGGSRRELVSWVLTGSSPEPQIPAGPRFGLFAQLRSGGHDLADAVAAAEPGVEWRLARVGAATVFKVPGRLGELHALHHLRGAWPDDERLRAVLGAGGVDEGAYLAELLMVSRYGLDQHTDELRRRPSFDRLVASQGAAVRAALGSGPDEIEGVAAALAFASADSLRSYAPEIAALLTDSSKRRRTAGTRLAARLGYAELAPHLELIAVEGNSAARAAAVRALGWVAGDEHRGQVLAFVARLDGDRSAAVADAIEELHRVQQRPAVDLDVTLPEVDATPPGDEVRLAVERMYERAYEQQRARYERAQEWARENPELARRLSPAQTTPPDRAPKKLIDATCKYVALGGKLPARAAREGLHQARHVLGELKPIHAFRLLRVAGEQFRWGAPISKLVATYRDTGHPTAAELQAAGEAAGYERRQIMAAMPRRLPWSKEDTWPWVAALLPEFMDAIAAGQVDYWDSIEKYYDAIAALPALPGELRQLLLTQAISGRKGHRPLAKAALADDPDLVPSIIEYLSSRKNDERAEAALWLAELRAEAATDALHRAATKEKHDYAKGAILTALERLGEPIDEYLDREKLLAEATKGLQKKIPAAAGWIPFDSLPALRWDDGTTVDPAIVEWLVIQAVRLKSPSPSPIVRRFFERMDDADVEAFATTILSLWLAEDVRPISLEQANEMARGQAQAIRSHPHFYPELAHMSEDQLVAHFLPRYVSMPAGSAAASKGILSLAAAGGGLAVVAPVEAYLRKWYGHRSSQCKALVELLAWIDDPTATQLLLSVGSRFRTKGIQQEAARQAELLAERKGWTLEDLAYRTVPSGGFDASGTQVLDYGERQFTARLADDLTIVLTNPDGKQIKSLPAARKSEDPDQVKLAKKELSDARKQIKAAAKEQPIRLHEAMCSQRRFEVDDFGRYVLDHPVMSRLATRLVWVATGAGEERLFRPLSDGTLLDVDDEELGLDGAEAVRLAHAAVDGDGAGARWMQHFADYEVTPLFPQFDRPSIPQLEQGQTLLSTCRGAIIDDRRLRSVMSKLSYEMGPGEDAGAVFVIRRRFPTAGLEARVAVRGLFATIVEQDVALEGLDFGPLDEPETTPLAEVPPVLLVETIADVDAMVAAGDGIAEDWEQRVGW